MSARGSVITYVVNWEGGQFDLNMNGKNYYFVFF